MKFSLNYNYYRKDNLLSQVEVSFHNTLQIVLTIYIIQIVAKNAKLVGGLWETACVTKTKNSTTTPSPWKLLKLMAIKYLNCCKWEACKCNKLLKMNELLMVHCAVKDKYFSIFTRTYFSHSSSCIRLKTEVAVLKRWFGDEVFYFAKKLRSSQ